MVRHKQPASLFATTHKWVARYIGDRLVNSGYDTPSKQTLTTVRLKLRPYFMEHLPASLRATLLEHTGAHLLEKSLAAGVDCDYGKSVLHLLYLLLSPDVRKLKVTLCCYYGCRDLEKVLGCIKRNGVSLEYLELARTSLLRMDPLQFSNVLNSATRLSTLVVRNICSDAMLKLIGNHCSSLQVLIIANSKQVTDLGVESLCCRVSIKDKGQAEVDTGDRTDIDRGVRIGERCGEPTVKLVQHPLLLHQEFSRSVDSLGCVGFSTWRAFRNRFQTCLKQGPTGSYGSGTHEVLLEVKQVLQPICLSLRTLDITDTSITNVGLHMLCRKVQNLNSLGEYSISDSFLRSLCVVSSLQMDKFPLLSLHARKVSYTGMYNLVHVFGNIKSLTCWEPMFDIWDLSYLPLLRQLTLIRVRYSEPVLNSIIHYFENCKGAKHLEKICLEFIVQDQDTQDIPVLYSVPEVDVSKIFHRCEHLKVFIIEFKDSLQATPSLGYSSYNNPRNVTRACFQSLAHVQFGQMVQNSVVSVILGNCPNLVNFHANHCPDLGDANLSEALPIEKAATRGKLRCFYIYEAPLLTENSFYTILEAFPNLRQFGNLSRWRVNCEGIQQIVRSIRDNNLEVEILCGSHWFQSSCEKEVTI